MNRSSSVSLISVDWVNDMLYWLETVNDTYSLVSINILNHVCDSRAICAWFLEIANIDILWVYHTCTVVDNLSMKLWCSLVFYVCNIVVPFWWQNILKNWLTFGFLNQLHAWFLDITFLQLSVCLCLVCVCVYAPEATNN